MIDRFWVAPFPTHVLVGVGGLLLWVGACRRDPPSPAVTAGGPASSTSSQTSALPVSSAVPAVVPSTSPPPDSVVAVAAGANNSFAILADGTVKAWGGNNAQTLGLGKERPIVVPTPVPGLRGVKQIGAGAMHSCALLTDGTVRCWGRNFGGALGDGKNDDYTTSNPTPVLDLANIEELRVGGNHACARGADGAGHCWGMIISGIGNRAQPVPKLRPIAGLALGGDATCAWHPDGTASCWDLAIGLPFNYGDAVTDGDGNIKPVTAVKGLSGVQQLSLSGHHACAVTQGAELWCWGSGKRGQLGDGRFGGGSYTLGTTLVDGYTVLKPQPVPEVTGVLAVALAAESTCALVGSGQVRCWGANDLGQLGVGDKKQRTKPAPVAGLDGVVELAAGNTHFCARTRPGEVYCWGDGIQGQVGDGSKGVSAVRTTPVRVLPAP